MIGKPSAELSGRSLAINNNPHLLIEPDGLIHLARKTIDQESTAAIFPSITSRSFFQNSLHRILKQLHCDLHRNDCAFTNVCPNKITILRTFPVLFSTKEIAG